VCLNVLEHIEDDRATLADMYSLLAPGGRLVLLVPAFQRLYSSLDVHLRHFRRYEKDDLAQKIRDAGFTLDDLRFANRPGILGWWLNGKVLRRRVLPRGQLLAFKFLMPLLRREEKQPPTAGLSLIALATKK
jgi:SAM-dependent methyltransferase